MTISAADREAPFRVAVKTTFSSPCGIWLAAVAENVAVDEEIGTITEEGAKRAELFTETGTDRAADVAALESVMVQLALAPAFSCVGLQARLVIIGGAARLNATRCEVPFNDAVTVAL